MCVYPVNVARLQGNGHERCRQDDIPLQEIKRLCSNWVSIDLDSIFSCHSHTK
jgi:hypothetical protein